MRRRPPRYKLAQRDALPENANKDEIKATVNDGLLTIDIPKIKTTEKQPAIKQIEIQ